MSALHFCIKLCSSYLVLHDKSPKYVVAWVIFLDFCRWWIQKDSADGSGSESHSSYPGTRRSWSSLGWLTHLSSQAALVFLYVCSPCGTMWLSLGFLTAILGSWPASMVWLCLELSSQENQIEVYDLLSASIISQAKWPQLHCLWSNYNLTQMQGKGEN